MRTHFLRQTLHAARHSTRGARCHNTRTHFGQPLHETHPHLLKSGELTPGITSIEYHERRAKFAKSLPDKSVAVLAAADLKYKSGAVFYEYKQDSDFFYLTGFNEPDSLAVIEKNNDDYRFHLFVRPKDAHAESWDGARSGVDAAKEVFNADESSPIDSISGSLPNLLRHAHEIYTNLPCHGTSSSQTALQKAFRASTPHPLTAALQSLSAPNTPIRSCRTLLNALRVVKSPAEVAVMRRAGQESGRVITDAMRAGPFASEKELWTFIEGGFRMRGLDGSAYLPVVAGGTNGLMIHYVRNDHLLAPTDLVLLDGAGELGGYASDITRTWPQDRKFTAAQRDLYQMLLDVQRTCVSLCRQDAQTSLDGIHKIAETGLRDGLKRLGFDLSGSGKGLEVLFPHHVGHHVGLDVHDCSGVARTGRLVEGNCITIEPGIYVPSDDRWPKHFQGMAMRIEDSVCVTEEHPFVLTTEAVKEIVDIEALEP